MNGIIEESTIERMEEIRGKPIRRGLDKAINECLDKLESEEELKQNPPCWIESNCSEQDKDEDETS